MGMGTGSQVRTGEAQVKHSLLSPPVFLEEKEERILSALGCDLQMQSLFQSKGAEFAQWRHSATSISPTWMWE